MTASMDEWPGSEASSAAARILCALKLRGQASTADLPSVISSRQSAFRAQVRAVNAAATRQSMAGAAFGRPARPHAQYTARTRHATSPIEGRYRKRSAMIVPIGNNRLETGRNATNANPEKKKAVRLTRAHV